jgi:hypothetical protein
MRSQKFILNIQQTCLDMRYRTNLLRGLQLKALAFGASSCWSPGLTMGAVAPRIRLLFPENQIIFQPRRQSPDDRALLNKIGDRR